MKFDWDEAKRRFNIRKHGIDFLDVAKVFDGDILTIEDDRYEYGENRFITLGILRDHVIVIAHTETETLIRIISARKATRNEEKLYFEQIAD
jgi:hypothetical protein